LTIEEDEFDTPIAFETVLELEEKGCARIKLNEAQLVRHLSN